MAFEYVPSSEINKQIISLTKTLNINQNRLSVLLRPFDSLKTLEKLISLKKEEIEKEKDEVIRRRLITELKTLEKRYDDTKNSITPDLEKQISILRGIIDVNNKELDELKKKLEESLKYEELLNIRNSSTIVRSTDISSLFGDRTTINISKGQKVDTLVSQDNGNTYIKISNLDLVEGYNITKKTVNYNSVLIIEDGKIISPPDVVGPIKRLISVAEESSPIELRGSETNYLSQTFNYDTQLLLSPTTGFIMVDADRLDGDLSLWVLISSSRFAA